MYYALFDLEYDKDLPLNGTNSLYRPLYDPKALYLMKNPLLYKIGMNDECLYVSLFVRWLFYGLFHAMIIFIVCFMGLNQIG
jgi:magnesium-transporting ATPase (P-type)